MNRTLGSSIYRERRYTAQGRWCSWFEECPVLSVHWKYAEVESKDYPDTPLYPGGTFRVNLSQLLTRGRAYHSRHGEYFYLEKPRQGDLFPSKDVLSMPSRLELEASQLGWELGNFNEVQFELYMRALKTGESLVKLVEGM